MKTLGGRGKTEWDSLPWEWVNDLASGLSPYSIPENANPLANCLYADDPDRTREGREGNLCLLILYFFSSYTPSQSKPSLLSLKAIRH